MNPDQPLTPREELEMRITSLLLGELSEAEAAAVRAEIARDAELQKLHDDLKQTIVLVREATVAANDATPEPVEPLKLSDERRAKLRAAFIIPPLKPEHVQKKTPGRRTLIELLVVVAIIGILASIMLPALSKSKSKAQSVAVRSNLRQLDMAKQMWAEDNQKSAGAQPTMEDLKPYLGGRDGLPSVRNETYQLGRVGEPVTAELDGRKVTMGSESRLFAKGPNANATTPASPSEESPIFLRASDKTSLLAKSSAEPQVALFDAQVKSDVKPESTSQVELTVTKAKGVAANTRGFYDDNFAPGQSTPPTEIVLPKEGAVDSAVAGGGGGGFDWSFGGTASPVVDRRLESAERPATRPVEQKFAAFGMDLSQQDSEQTRVAGEKNAKSPAVKAGSGTLTVSGPNRFVGGTVVSGGSLEVNGRDRDVDGLNESGDRVVNFGAIQAGRPADELKPAAGDSSISTAAPTTAVSDFAGFANSAVTPGIAGLATDSPAAKPASAAEPAQANLYFQLDQSGRKDALAENKSRQQAGAEGEPVLGEVPITGAWFASKLESDKKDFGDISAVDGSMSDRLKRRAPSYLGTPAAATPPPSESRFEAVGEPLGISDHEAARAASGNGVVLGRYSYVQVTNAINLASGLDVDALQARELDVRALDQKAQPSRSELAKSLGETKSEEAAAKPLKQLAATLEKSDAPLPRKPSTNAPIAQPEVLTSDNNFSTFSLNVSDVSFKLAAASLEKGQMPDSAGIRSEEFINAFDYRDPEAAAGAPIAFAWERARYPFAHNRDLLRFSLKTAAAGRQAGRPLNIVLLLDNSGSMERADRVAIIREALHVLAKQLQPQDKLSVITFARTPRLVADGVAGDKAGEVTEQVGGLTPEGGTNLGDAMNLAYQTATKHFVANGINRVVVLTDGAANLGDVEPESLKRKVEANRQQGIALDCFGIGWEGFNDDLLEVLSRNGDGRYGFINSPEEAATEFAGQLAGALKVAASDVKVQVEWNPKRVTAYRQIGYAKHQLTKEQFRDNTVDAAEIAAQEAGNALYTVEVNPAGEGPLGTVRCRYKIPGTTDYREMSWEVPFTGNAPSLDQSSAAMRLATTASAFSEWLAVNPFASEITPDALLKNFNGVPEAFGADPRPKKLEWMIRQAKSLEGK